MGFLTGGKRVIPSMVVMNYWGGKSSGSILDKALGPFDQTDKGLVYYSDQQLEDYGLKDTFKQIVY